MIASTPQTGETPAGVGIPVPREDFHPGRDYFAARRSPFGQSCIDLIIGPLRMRIDGLSEPQAIGLEARFSPFVSVPDGRPDLTIGLRRAAVGGFLKLPAPGMLETYRLESRPEAGRVAIWSYEFAGWVEPGQGRAELDLAAAEGALFDRGLENFLRVMTASFILRQGGLLLHAAGVVRGGRAHIFFGPSGAGKTTVTRLSPRDVVLSDDLTLIVPGTDGAGPQAVGIPFGMAHHHVPDTNGSFPIATLNRLVQSPLVRRTEIPYSQAVAEVASSLPFVMQETGQAMLAMEIAAAILRDVPVHRLEFCRDDSFWSVVEEG